MQRISRLILCILLLVCIIFLMPFTSHAASEKRTALVIGNSSYTISPLKNPIHDATDMADALKRLGFKVILKTNATNRDMGKAVEEFGKLLRGRDVGLFYYAGHGVQVNGINYLIPVGAKINEETDVEYEAMDVGKILATMYNTKSRINIVILDACRDNPYVRSFRSTTRGLAIISKAPSGTIISYSTSPGDVALDGKGRNSPYTSSLLQFIKEPGLTIEQVFKNVRQKIDTETGGKQVPWELSSLKGEFYFSPGRPSTTRLSPEAYEDKGKDVAMARPPKKEPVEELETYTSPTTGAKFVLIPAGTFMMGSPNYEVGRALSQRGEQYHQVTISRPFFMQTTEVTQGQWKAVMGDTPMKATISADPYLKTEDRSRAVMGNNPSYFKNCGDDCPVENVSWHDAQEFVRRLNQKEMTDKYRLPTEAEWEYAARAGTTTPFYTGYCLSTDQANYNGRSPLTGCPKGQYRRKTVQVGSFPPNPWGLYDMYGNVMEWVQDWYGDYPAGHLTDPVGPPSGEKRVLRGGSWCTDNSNCRSASRLAQKPEYVSDVFDFYGFRIVRTP